MDSVYFRDGILIWRSTPALGWYEEVGIIADPIEVRVKQRGNISHFPPAVRNVDLDNVYNCAALNNAGFPIGLINVTFTMEDHSLSITYISSPIDLTISQQGDYKAGILLSTTALLSLTATVTFGDIILEAAKSNWISWSNIGSLDFTIWKDNVAGTRPLDWKGWVYAVKKLDKKVVAYGENGVSLLTPSGNIWGLQTIHRVGLIGKGAICGSGFEHFFIDRTGKLFSLKASLDLLNYSEYLIDLSPSVLMHYDEQERLIYICDGKIGFIYSPDTKSLGTGPPNITGIGHLSGTDYYVGAGPFLYPFFEICTDIYDMESRKKKTIQSVSFGVDDEDGLYAAIDYRNSKSEDFRTTAWQRVGIDGIVNIPCFGTEFRFRLKSLTYSDIELDYIKVNGFIHNYSYLDTYNRGGTT